MGSLLVVFLRRALIVEERLPFPEGRACADVLRAGQGAGESASRGQIKSAGESEPGLRLADSATHRSRGPIESHASTSAGAGALTLGGLGRPHSRRRRTGAGAGALLAIVFLATDAALARCQSRWRTPVMPIAIGLYLPFGLGGAILAGALARELFGAHDGGYTGRGALIAAGMIAGEALTGVVGGALITGGVKLPLF